MKLFTALFSGGLVFFGFAGCVLAALAIADPDGSQPFNEAAKLAGPASLWGAVATLVFSALLCATGIFMFIRSWRSDGKE